MSVYSSNTLKRILNKLNKYDDEDIKKVMDYYIKKEEKNVYNKNFTTDTIGYKSDINKSHHDILDLKEIKEINISGTSFWIGFIPKDIKIVYYFEIKNFEIANYGYYFYMNDYNYIYDFAKYIKNKNVKNDFSFLIHAHDFIYNYFFTIYNTVTREQLHHLIYDKPTNEHNITDFKGNNSAQCSEYAAMLQNILSVFGYETVYIHGELDEGEEKNVNHAFNLAVMDNNYSIVDIAIPTNCYDHNNRIKRRYPYLYEMDNFDENDLENFLSGETDVYLNDLESHIINNECYSFCKVKKRVYRTDQMIFDD